MERRSKQGPRRPSNFQKKLDSQRGKTYWGVRAMTLAELDGDELRDIRSIGQFGEVHPELFADENTRLRLGLDAAEV